MFFEIFTGLKELVNIIKLQATVRVDCRMVQYKLTVVDKEDVTLFLNFNQQMHTTFSLDSQ
jgi:hypothetical protein